MEVYHLKVQNLRFKEAINKIIVELKKLYAVKLVAVNISNSEVKIVLGELGSILACQELLKNMGFPVVQIYPL